MRTLKTLSVAAVAALALSAAAAASASAALPEFSLNAGALTGEAIGNPVLYANEDKSKVECGVSTLTGNITSTTTVHVLVDFTECKGPSGTTCTSPGAANGTITSLLIGTLGYMNKAEKKVGILLTGDEANGGFAAEFECEILGFGSEIKVEGSIICLVTPVNTLTESYTIKCETDPETHLQIDNAFEGQEPDFLEAEAIGVEEFPLGVASEQATFLVHAPLGEIKA